MMLRKLLGLEKYDIDDNNDISWGIHELILYTMGVDKFKNGAPVTEFNIIQLVYIKLYMLAYNIKIDINKIALTETELSRIVDENGWETLNDPTFIFESIREGLGNFYYNSYPHETYNGFPLYLKKYIMGHQREYFDFVVSLLENDFKRYPPSYLKSTFELVDTDAIGIHTFLTMLDSRHLNWWGWGCEWGRDVSFELFNKIPNFRKALKIHQLKANS